MKIHRDHNLEIKVFVITVISNSSHQIPPVETVFYFLLINLFFYFFLVLNKSLLLYLISCAIYLFTLSQFVSQSLSVYLIWNRLIDKLFVKKKKIKNNWYLKLTSVKFLKDDRVEISDFRALRKSTKTLTLGSYFFVHTWYSCKLWQWIVDNRSYSCEVCYFFFFKLYQSVKQSAYIETSVH